MTIVAPDSERSHRIGVLGTLTDPRERAELIALLDAEGDQPLRVDCYDADTLPPEVLDALARRLDRGAPVKIMAYHGLLGHCLMRAGLPHQQVLGQGREPAPATCQALVLAGSANSLDKIIYLVDHLPLAPVAVFIVQHVGEDQVNILDQLLKVHTDYVVLMPQHLVAVAPGTIYIAPPGHHMKVAHGLVYLTRDPKVQCARPSIDVLFASLALEYGRGLLAILLCGFGTDGVAGCADLQDAGARVLLQDCGDCGKARVLVEGAKAAGRFDQVLKLPALASVAAAAVLGPVARPGGELLERFLEALWSQYGYDFRGYQRDSLRRRIQYLMTRFGLPEFGPFQWAILTDGSLFQRLVAEISVGVTGFFRHPEQFLDLRREVLPYLASFPTIKAWSAGCATGEEPYSLAILFEELELGSKSRIFATDLNPYFLDLAQSGRYPVADLDASRDNYLKSGGPASFDEHVAMAGHTFRVLGPGPNPPLFHQNSLVDEGVFNEFHLILCRNVLIYFDQDTQSKILRRFRDSLHPDGFLALGPQDSVGRLALAEGFSPCPGQHQIYKIQKGGQGV